MTEKQLIKAFGFIFVMLLGILGWSLNQNFMAIKSGQTDIQDSIEENREDIKMNFRELSGLSARVSMVEK